MFSVLIEMVSLSIAYRFYSNATYISYIKCDCSGSGAMVPATNAFFGFDRQNVRLWYIESFTLKNSYLDGSDNQDVPGVFDFGPLVVNGVNETIYYLDKNDGNKVKGFNFDGTALDNITALQIQGFHDLGIGINLTNQ